MFFDFVDVPLQDATIDNNLAQMLTPNQSRLHKFLELLQIQLSLIISFFKARFDREYSTKI